MATTKDVTKREEADAVNKALQRRTSDQLRLTQGQRQTIVEPVKPKTSR